MEEQKLINKELLIQKRDNDSTDVYIERQGGQYESLMVQYVDKKQLLRIGQQSSEVVKAVVKSVVTVAPPRTSVHAALPKFQDNKVDHTLKKKIYESQTRKVDGQKTFKCDLNLKNMTNVLSDDDTDTTSRVSFLKKKKNSNILDQSMTGLESITETDNSLCPTKRRQTMLTMANKGILKKKKQVDQKKKEEQDKQERQNKQTEKLQKRKEQAKQQAQRELKAKLAESKYEETKSQPPVSKCCKVTSTPQKQRPVRGTGRADSPILKGMGSVNRDLLIAEFCSTTEALQFYEHQI